VATSAEPQSNAYSEKLKQLLSFLRSEVEGEERISLAKAGFEVTEGSVQKEKGKARAKETVATASDLFSRENNLCEPLGCIFCEKTHDSRECFLAPTLPLRENKSFRRKGNIVSPA
jgi:hypothetical protein